MILEAEPWRLNDDGSCLLVLGSCQLAMIVGGQNTMRSLLAVVLMMQNNSSSCWDLLNEHNGQREPERWPMHATATALS